MRAATQIREELAQYTRTAGGIQNIWERRKWLADLLLTEVMLDVRELLRSRLTSGRGPGRPKKDEGSKKKK